MAADDDIIDLLASVDVTQDFNEVLKERFTALGCTASALAYRSGLDRSTVSRIFGDRQRTPDLYNAIALAKTIKELEARR